MRFIYALFDCVELFVTLVHVYIFFPLKGELFYSLFDGLRVFLNKAYCTCLQFICKAIKKCDQYCLQQLADSI